MDRTGFQPLPMKLYMRQLNILIIYKAASMAVVVSYEGAAIVLSIVALAAGPIVLLFFKHYYRALDFLQMCYLFALAVAPTSFSSHLTTAMIAFDKNLFTFCQPNDFVCSNGFPLSFAACLIAVLVLTFVFVMLQKCCNKTVEYEPVYSPLKGFIRWFYLPLTYSSTYWVIKEGKKAELDVGQIMAPAIILVCLLIFPFFQLIGYKCIQKEDTPPERKWMEWLSYCRLISTGILCALYSYYQQMKYLNCVFIVLGVYSFFYLIFGEYRYKCMERVIFFIGDGAFITLYFIFTYKATYITQYDLDLFLLAGVMAIDSLLYVIRGLRMFCFGPHEGVGQVVPQNAEEKRSPRAKYNKYDYDSGQDLQNSRDKIISSNRNNNRANYNNNSGVRRRR